MCLSLPIYNGAWFRVIALFKGYLGVLKHTASLGGKQPRAKNKVLCV